MNDRKLKHIVFCYVETQKRTTFFSIFNDKRHFLSCFGNLCEPQIFLEFTSSVKIRCSMFNVHNIVLNKKGGMFYVHILLLNVNYFSYTKTSFINFDRFELAIIKFSIKIIYKFRFIIMIVPRINYVIQEKYVLHIHMNCNIFKFIQSYE